MAFLNYRNPGQNIRLWRVYGRSVFKYGSIKKIANALRTEAAYRRRDVVVHSSPYILFVEPLYYCNLDCPLCDRQVFPLARKGDAGKLALDLFDRILDEIGDYLFQCQIFGQGEPLMNWKLTRSIIEKTHQRGIFSYLSTNCTLITPEIAEGLATSHLDYMVCAIDGITQESYEAYRSGGRLEDALAGMRMVNEARIRTKSQLKMEWQFLVHSRNQDDIPRAQQLARELGIPLRLAPLCGMEWDEEAERLWKPNSGPWSERSEPGKAINDFPCYFPWRSLVLNSNGKVARCLVYQNASQYADLNRMSAMEAYNHPSVQAARKLFRKDGQGADLAPSPCRSCGYFSRHHGDAITNRNSEVLLELADFADRPAEAHLQEENV